MLKTFNHLIKTMGIGYVWFRGWYELEKRSGLLKLKFGTKYRPIDAPDIETWINNNPPFFFQTRESLSLIKISDSGRNAIKTRFENLKQNKYLFFSASSSEYEIKPDDWFTNQETGYKYPLKHWTGINEMDPELGDIKYVWERSRFSFIYDIIRYDQHFQQDNSDLVFKLIDSWIENNPLNLGPNYVCSQEISLRCMNWTFALQFYKNSQHLNQKLLSKILLSIYNQTLHVKNNIRFSTVAVRNNHSITETQWLFLSGILYPFFPGIDKISKKGRKLLEKEIQYQFQEDGAFIQNSFNYQRVALQVLMWGLILGDKTNRPLSDRAKSLMQASVNLLMACQDTISGRMPNYGTNDGALFFQLNSLQYPDFRGQINAFHFYFYKATIFENADSTEDIFWFFNVNKEEPITSREIEYKPSVLTNSGYCIMRNHDYFSFIRINPHLKRPAQADNLHLDLWYNGKNIALDSGSYKYNTDEKTILEFAGTRGHNTVMIDGKDQMQKGSRFTWHNWNKIKYSKTYLERNFQVFEGRIEAFGQLAPGIEHKRIVKQNINLPHWEIEDTIFGTKMTAQQVWNLSPDFEELGFIIECFDINDNPIKPQVSDSFYSRYYGQKTKCKRYVFATDKRYFRTVIREN